MADKTVPVSYRKGKLRASGLGNFATLKDGASGEIPVMGDNGPDYSSLSDLLDDNFGSTRGALLMRGSSGWSKIDPGTSGFVLTSNGTGADPNYQDKSGAEKYISSQTASNSATLDFTSGVDNTYIAYRFRFEALVPVTNQVAPQLQFSANAGSSWITTNYDFSATTNASALPLAGSTAVTNTANLGASGDVILFNPASTTIFKSVTSNLNCSGVLPQFFAGYYTGSTAAVNGVRFLFSSGNISTGTIRMYGIKGS